MMDADWYKIPAMAELRITDLISSKLHTLAALMATHGAMSYQRKFSLTLHEWRAIAMLGSHAPLSLKDLARMAGLDKSYASRTTTSLIERSLVESTKSGEDGRAIMLKLTDKGKRLYRQAFKESVSRNERLLANLSEADQAQLSRMLSILTANARKLVEEERRIAAGEKEDAVVSPSSPVLPASGKGRSKSKSLAEEKLEEARSLVEQLNMLLAP